MAQATTTAKAGFDLTKMPAALFEELVDGMNYSTIDKGHGYKNFQWSDDSLTIVTGNNPITGESSRSDYRHPEKGYCSRIGLEGDEQAVFEAYEYIKEHGFTDGAQEFGQRSFI